MYKHILMPTDGSELSKRAIESGMQFAASIGAKVSGLYVRNFGDLFRDKAEYKTAKRVEIEAKGYTIIANIGNTPTDLSGGHAEKTYKLPDYDGQLS